MDCPYCGSTLIRTTDPSNEPADHLRCVDCLSYFVRPREGMDRATRLGVIVLTAVSAVCAGIGIYIGWF